MIWKMIRRCFACWLLPAVLFAGVDNGSILLYNDSPFILTAIVQAADGTYLGQFTIQPGQQKNVTQNLFPTSIKRPGTPQVSLTPYTVIWQCASEGFYCSCIGVSPGSLVRASDCPGTHFCKPKKEDDKGVPSSTLEKKK
jgi:hypothetical protein